ncbi:MAG: response regulator [Candidatus Omnitrophica bacterium]|nr:response regulator [Candidatus Omnitrophota bacterium]MDD5352002.1 response regulator [Candidatus Omnitrophota bacterium]MDD5551056.1 response regulator [Candidatus Omnitrophota bacterium]
MIKTILVADDELEISSFLKKALERKRCVVSVASDGLKAKEILDTKSFDAVLLDCSMPGLTGPELIKVIRQKSPLAKIIIFSGYSAVDGKLAQDLGADGFMQKPLTIKMIEQMLKLK